MSPPTCRTPVHFGYTDTTGGWHPITTLEEDEYPAYYQTRPAAAAASTSDGSAAATGPVAKTATAPTVKTEKTLIEGHREFQENQRGISYDTLLLPYLAGASKITIIDPYIRMPHQGRNLVDLLALLAAHKDPADEISVTLTTREEKNDPDHRQLFMLKSIQDSAAGYGINFTVTWDDHIHDRSIRSDNGWTILLGRSLDIFQKGSGSQFDLGARRQEFRQVAAFGVTYIRDGSAAN